MRVHIPTINDDPADFDFLFELWEQVNHDGLTVTFDFTECQFLRQNAVAFIGGLARLIKHRSGSVALDKSTLTPKVKENLGRQGFLSAFGDHTPFDRKRAIPYREDRQMAQDDLVAYLKTKWLASRWVRLSPQLKGEIVGRVVEIYVNAFDHGRSPIGVMSCGQYYPQLEELKLTAIDFGVGIPSNVRVFVKNPKMDAASTLKWAFQVGNTTQQGEIGRGLGLGLLKEFVRLNKGRLEFYSGEGYAVIAGSEFEEYRVRSSSFGGTLVNITIQCNQRYYRLRSEGSQEPLFG